MKRRNLLRVATAAPVAPLVTEIAAGQPPQQARPPVPEVKLNTSAPDAVGDAVPKFFTQAEMSAMRRLAAVLMPPTGNLPGAIEAGAPEFLDFLVGQSGPELQQVYRTGLDALNAQSRQRFQKTFAEVDATQANDLMTPLRAKWSPEPVTDPLTRFLQQAKKDVRTATMNSREWAAANAANGQRRFGGGSLYFLPLE